MADEWKAMHTFTSPEIMLAEYFENMRQNYFHIREPRYSVVYGKNGQDGPATAASGLVSFAFTLLPTSIIDPVTIDATGRDILVASNIAAKTSGSATNPAFGFSVRMDGNVLYEGGLGEGITGQFLETNFYSLPLMYIVRSPTPGDHTFQLSWSLSAAATTTVTMSFGPKFFLLAMEI